MRNVRKEGLILNKKRILVALSVWPDRVPKGRELLLSYQGYYQVTGRPYPAEAGAVLCPGCFVWFSVVLLDCEHVCVLWSEICRSAQLHAWLASCTYERFDPDVF